MDTTEIQRAAIELRDLRERDFAAAFERALAACEPSLTGPLKNVVCKTLGMSDEARALDALFTLFDAEVWGAGKNPIKEGLVASKASDADARCIEKYRACSAKSGVSTYHALEVIARRRSADGKALLLSLAVDGTKASDFTLWRSAVSGLACHEDADAVAIVTGFLGKKEFDWNEDQAVNVVIEGIYAGASPERAYALLAPYVAAFFADNTTHPKVALRAVFSAKDTLEKNGTIDPRWFDLLEPKWDADVGEMKYYVPVVLALCVSPRRVDFWIRVHQTKKDLGMVVLRSLATIKDDDRVTELLRAHLGTGVAAASVAYAAGGLLDRGATDLKEPILAALGRAGSRYDVEALGQVAKRLCDAGDAKRIKGIAKTVKAREVATPSEKKWKGEAVKAIDALAKELA